MELLIGWVAWISVSDGFATKVSAMVPYFDLFLRTSDQDNRVHSTISHLLQTPGQL